MKLIARFCLVLWTFSLACAGRPTSIEQLKLLVRSGISSGRTDAQVARSLTEVEMSERLSDAALAELASLGAGSRTKDLLQILAGVSAFLEPSNGPLQAAGLAAEPEAEMILARARSYAVGYVQSLPDFVCARVTRRFDSAPDLAGRLPVLANLRYRDTIVGELSYNHGVETFIDSTTRGDLGGVSAELDHGLSSYGDFGNILAHVFMDPRAQNIQWAGWESLNGMRLAVFHYSITAELSRYRVGYCCIEQKAVSVQAANRGYLYIEPDSGSILRITRKAVDLPPDFPTTEAATIVDYRPVQIGSSRYLLPVRSLTLSTSTPPLMKSLPASPVQHLNDVRFLRHRQFLAESRMLGDDPADSADSSVAAGAEEPEPWVGLSEPEAPETPDAPTAVAAGAPAPVPGPISVPVPDEPGATIHAITQLVEVPVVVRSRDGKQLMDLKPEDFEVFDNGQLQELRLFSVQKSVTTKQARPLASSADTVPGAPLVFSNRAQEIVDRGSLTVILIDSTNLAWSDSAYTYAQINKFLRTLPPNSQVALYTMRWQSFAILRGFTADSSRMAARMAAMLGPQTAPDEFPEWFDNDQQGTLANSNRSGLRNSAEGGRIGSQRRGKNEKAVDSIDPLRVLTAIAKHLAKVPGRKNLVWITAGIPQVILSRPASASQRQQQPGGGLPTANYASSALVQLQQAFNDSNVAIYCVDSRGIETAFADAKTRVPTVDGAPVYDWDFVQHVSQTHTEGIVAGQSMMLDLATNTGGRAFFSNDIAGDIQRALDDSQVTYRLGYYPQGLSQAGAFHKINVKLSGHADVRLGYRRGYFDAKDSGGRKATLNDLLLTQTNAAGISMTAQLAPVARGYDLRLSIDLAAVELQAAGDRFKGKLEVACVQLSEDGEPLERLVQTVGLQLKKATFAQMLKSGFLYQRSLVLKPEATSLRLAVRDTRSSSTGSLSVALPGR